LINAVKLAVSPHCRGGGGAAARLNEEHLLTLAEMVAKQPDATLEELRQQVQRETHRQVSISTVWRGLERIEFTQKKDSLGARG
jgi:transposase